MGISKFKNYILESKFLIDKEVLTSASKVLYLIYLMKSNEETIKRYNGQEIDLNNIKAEYKKLINTIDKINPEACFYLINSRYFN